MYAILISAFNTVLGWVLRALVFKVIVFGVLLFVTTEATQYMLEKLTEVGNPTDTLQSSISGIGSGALYFIGLLRLDVGIPLILSAYVTGFAIRRLPIIG
ncbi:DUF2523 family protein [Novosphingobium naphthalenivorans]|uniref:DUF2523 family protein n=1 Tax=Novosphingobium naphthalenivorans TaxID=273168 RepID=UPI000832B173|nr:DUF2523 family protein [Novosphingobium naphthalenivorans]